jgi:hypothetical protein
MTYNGMMSISGFMKIHKLVKNLSHHLNSVPKICYHHAVPKWMYPAYHINKDNSEIALEMQQNSFVAALHTNNVYEM